MGSRGPVPKRMAERLGHVTKAQRASVSSVVMVGEVRPLPLPKDIHPIARRWYNALKRSGEARYFEPSDWAAAVFVAEAMTRLLNNRRFSGETFSAIWKAMGDLLTTEADRRRARMEIERVTEQLVENEPTVLDEYRRRLGT